MKKILNKLTIFFCLTVIFSCKDFVEVGPPSNKVASSTVFLSEETAIAAINGLYITLANTSGFFASGGSTVYLGLYSDELAYNLSSTSTTIPEFANSNLSAANSVVSSNFWTPAYKVINQANSCISGLQKSSLSPPVVDQLLGEAYFIRAFCYWNLLTLFGDVPLVLNAEDYESVGKMSRTPSTDVRGQLLNDLLQAKKLLKPPYPTAGRYRVNYFTVVAFLSRVHTFLGNWNEVLTSSNEVISQTATYTLEADLNRTFLIGSTEAIWQTASGNSTTNTFEALDFIPFASATAIPNYALQTELFNTFTANDKRKVNWIAIKTVSGTTYRYPYKYKVRPVTPKTECQMMIRLAEIYLNRAEAKAHLNDPTAIDDLNKTRFRAGIGNLTGITGQALLDAIIQERRLELFAEWGLRFFDLRRTNTLDLVLAPLKPEWKSTNALFPIPLNELMSAPNLKPNPGYN